MFFHFYEFYFRISFKNFFVKFFKKDCTKRSNLFIFLFFMLEVCVGNHRLHHLRLLLPRQQRGKEEHLK